MDHYDPIVLGSGPAGQRAAVQAAKLGAVKERIGMEDLKIRTSYVIKREIDVVRAQMLRNGVDLIYGEASFSGPHELTVPGPKDKNTLSSDFIVVAVGTRPDTPPGISCDDETLIDSDGILAGKSSSRSRTSSGSAG